MDIANFRPATLRQGAGNGDPTDGLCLMQMVDWFSGARVASDRPACASPVLSIVGIMLNDMATDEQRKQLWPLVWQLLESQDDGAEQARSEHILREIVHRVIARIFHQIGLLECAKALRAARTMYDIQISAMLASDTAMAMTWKEEAAPLEAASRAAIWAAAAAEAAREAAWAAASAQAARAAWAALAAMTTAQRVPLSVTAIWIELHAIFIEAIQLGRHGEADLVHISRAIELQQRLLHPAMEGRG